MNIPRHIGFIPDGNRRFARERGYTLDAAYRLGADRAIDVVEWALALGATHVSGYALSTTNLLQRTKDEIVAILRAAHHFIAAMPARRVRPVVVGSIAPVHGWDPAVEQIEASLADGVSDPIATVYVAMNADDAVETIPAGHQIPPMDLLLRAGARRRLSGFLPAQVANAELWFVDTLWPQFSRDEFDRAIAWYGQQERTRGD